MAACRVDTYIDQTFLLVRLLTLTTACIFFTLTLAAQSAIGTWVTIDDNTGKPRSEINIAERSGMLYGTIAATLSPDATKTCTSCSGDRANQPYIGMEIISDAKPEDNNEWEGKIYDPEGDSTYKLIMWLEEDPNVLYVRGKHWTGLYRTQTWQRK